MSVTVAVAVEQITNGGGRLVTVAVEVEQVIVVVGVVVGGWSDTVAVAVVKLQM